jgi:hypothetical protein
MGTGWKEKGKQEEKKGKRKKEGKMRKMKIKKELFYLFLEIMIHKFYLVYYYYIIKNRI